MSLRILGVISFALLASSISASAQFISVGVKGGIPLTDGFSDVCCGLPSVTTNRYIIGPQVELRLPFHLGVEADALYKHYSLGGAGISQWEFPVLLKYRFKGVPLVHPFADAGPIFNHVTGSTSLGAQASLAAGSTLSSFTGSSTTVGISSTNTGFALGAGLDFHPIFLHITPEFRYIHWTAPGSSSQINSISQNQNQAEFLVGISF